MEVAVVVFFKDLRFDKVLVYLFLGVECNLAEQLFEFGAHLLSLINVFGLFHLLLVLLFLFLLLLFGFGGLVN